MSDELRVTASTYLAALAEGGDIAGGVMFRDLLGPDCLESSLEGLRNIDALLLEMHERDLNLAAVWDEPSFHNFAFCLAFQVAHVIATVTGTPVGYLTREEMAERMPDLDGPDDLSLVFGLETTAGVHLPLHAISTRLRGEGGSVWYAAACQVRDILRALGQDAPDPEPPDAGEFVAEVEVLGEEPADADAGGALGSWLVDADAGGALGSWLVEADAGPLPGDGQAAADASAGEVPVDAPADAEAGDLGAVLMEYVSALTGGSTIPGGIAYHAKIDTARLDGSLASLLYVDQILLRLHQGGIRVGPLAARGDFANLLRALGAYTVVVITSTVDLDLPVVSGEAFRAAHPDLAAAVPHDLAGVFVLRGLRADHVMLPLVPVIGRIDHGRQHSVHVAVAGHIGELQAGGRSSD